MVNLNKVRFKTDSVQFTLVETNIRIAFGKCKRTFDCNFLPPLSALSNRYCKKAQEVKVVCI